MENDLKTIVIKIPSSVKPEIRKYQAYANTLRKDCLFHDDFLCYLNRWKFTTEMIRDLKSVMLEYPKCSLNEEQMKWLEEYCNSIVTTDGDVTINKPSYSDDLIKLFNGNTYLIEQLIGKSDNDIAHLIKNWAKEKDKFGKPLIENPENGLKSSFAKELKANGIIKQSKKTFRIKL